MSIDIARKLIQERELNSEYLEKAENLLLDIVNNHHTPQAYGMLSEIQYWKGEIALKENKISLYEKGIEFGKKGFSLDKDNIESNFWLAVCYALFGDERGMMSSFFLLEPIESHLSHSLKLNESYFYGAPLRVFGLFFHKIPGWPISKGDNRKALSYLERALVYGPEFYLNHLYISWIYKSLGEKSKFHFHLEWILEAHPTRKYSEENHRYKEQAKLLLDK